MNYTLIAQTVPGTHVTVSITVKGEWFYVARTAQVGIANYLSCARTTEAEARTVANDLWIDAVNRRNLSSVRKVVS